MCLVWFLTRWFAFVLYQAFVFRGDSNVDSLGDLTKTVVGIRNATSEAVLGGSNSHHPRLNTE